MREIFLGNCLSLSNGFLFFLKGGTTKEVYLMLLVIFHFCHRYAIGGLSGGEDKDSFWRIVAQCTAVLPEDKPRYVMVIILNNTEKQAYIGEPA